MFQNIEAIDLFFRPFKVLMI